jgi:hypothetical protein
VLNIEIQSHGFRISDEDYLIIINQVGRERWQYDFYKSISIDDNTRMEPATAPFEAQGDPWQQSRYKDSLFTNCMMKLLISGKEETQKLVQNITTELYKVSQDYTDLQNQRSGFDYQNTVDGIPTTNLKYRLHPSMDFFDNKLFLGYRFIDDSLNKKEWIVDSTKHVWTKEKLLQSKIAVKEKDIIGDQRWLNIQALHEQQTNSHNLFTLIRTKLTHHIWFSNPISYDVLTLWIMGTYMYWAFDSFPYIHLSGTPDSGKSRVQRLSSCLTFNGYFTESISNSSIFRYVEDMRASLHIDEQEYLGTGQISETVSILNSGYHKAGNATRQESYTDKDGNKKFMTVSFSTYSPKMLSGIGGLDKTLKTRSISIPMKPTTDKQYSRREVMQDDPQWQIIRDQLYLWALHAFDDVMLCYSEIKDQDIDIKNRMWQKYHVLLSLAYYFKKTTPSSPIYDNIIKFIKIDQITTIEHDDFVIDMCYKILYRLCQKMPNPKGQYPLKVIRDECCKALGMQEPYDYDDNPNLAYIKNIHKPLGTIGYKTVALTGNYRGIYVKIEDLEIEAIARGINLNTPIITM